MSHPSVPRRDYYARVFAWLSIRAAVHLRVATDHRPGDNPITGPRRNPLLDPDRRPPGMVAVACTAHGRFVSWCNPPAPTTPVRCPAACADATAAGGVR